MFLDGKVGVVTGSAMGLGKAIAIALAQEGADVACLDIRAAENMETAQEIRKLGRRAVDLSCDVADKNDVRRSINHVMREFGRVDVLVNNAGVYVLSPMVGADFDRISDDYDRLFAVNTKGTFLCTLAVVPIMLKQGRGEIINVVTNHVKRERYHAESRGHIYDATKWAQWSLNETWAAELKQHGIRVNGLCPAATDTAMLRSVMPNPSPEVLANWMKPADVALAAINVLKQGPDGPVGESHLIVTRKDAEKLAGKLAPA